MNAQAGVIEAIAAAASPTGGMELLALNATRAIRAAMAKPGRVTGPWSGIGPPGSGPAGTAPTSPTRAPRSPGHADPLRRPAVNNGAPHVNASADKEHLVTGQQPSHEDGCRPSSSAGRSADDCPTRQRRGLAGRSTPGMDDEQFLNSRGGLGSRDHGGARYYQPGWGSLRVSVIPDPL
jgi:hypothetical protein